MNPANPMIYAATCPVCGAHGFSPTGGLVWLACKDCGWGGQVQTVPTAGAAASSAGAIAGRLKAAGIGAQTTPGTAPQSGQFTAHPSWMANVPPVPPLVDLPDLTSYYGGLVNPGADTQPLTLPEALAGDARIYGEEIALALLDQPQVSIERDCRLSLPQVWDRIQEAQGVLFEALGGRHMGDYTPDLEQMSQALVGVGVWCIVALQVVGQMGDDGAGGAGGDAA